MAKSLSSIIIQRLEQNKDFSFENSSINMLLNEIKIYEEELLAQNNELCKQQKELMVANEKYFTLFNKSPISYMLIDKDYKIIEFNEAVKKQFPLLSKRGYSNSLLLYLRQGEITKMLNWLTRKSYEKSSLDIHLQNQDSYELYKLNATTYPDDKDLLLITCINIHKEYQINNDLSKVVKEQTKELHEQMDIISENIIYSRTNLKGKIIDVSSAFCKLSGYMKDELIGSPHNIIRHPDMPQEVFEDMWNSLKRNHSWKGEVKNMTKDGKSYWVYSDISPKYNKEGEITGYISVRSDITDRKIKEEQQLKMKEQEKMAAMGEMMANVAHQWRQPLSVISTIASGIAFKQQTKMLNEKDIISNMDSIVETANYLSKTINTFQNFLKEKKELKTICLQTKLDEMLNILSPSLKNNNIEIFNNLQNSSKIYLEIVSGELDQVIMNIINNAKDVLVEERVDNRWITIDSQIKQNFVVLTIEDNGGGIPNNVLPKIFEPYFTTKHKSQGTGLGLNMTYKIVTESLGGNIYAKNTTNGAKFYIEIPV